MFENFTKHYYSRSKNNFSIEIRRKFLRKSVILTKIFVKFGYRKIRSECIISLLRGVGKKERKKRKKESTGTASISTAASWRAVWGSKIVASAAKEETLADIPKSESLEPRSLLLVRGPPGAA